MSRTRLKAIYRKHGIKYGRPDVVFDRALHRGNQLAVERAAFARTLMQLQQQGTELIYMDESSFCAQLSAHKVWQYQDAPMKIA
jgi:hypothetical protein